MAALIGCGLFWARRPAARLTPEATRTALADVVYHFFLPALVLNVLWRAELGTNSLIIAASAAVGVLGSMLAIWLISKLFHLSRPVQGAMLLAASFPNATYMGYPLLTKTLGDWAGPVAIQYDLFACTPLLLTLGILLAARLGDKGERPHPVHLLIRVPPLWAAVIGVLLNLSGIPQPDVLTSLLKLAGSAVVPVMLFVIGLALDQGLREKAHFKLLVPVGLVQLLVMPALVLSSATLLALPADLKTAVVLEGAMPSMALGVVLCDRYGLNTGLYAAAVAATTLVSLASLPLWHGLMVA